MRPCEEVCRRHAWLQSETNEPAPHSLRTQDNQVQKVAPKRTVGQEAAAMNQQWTKSNAAGD